MDYKTADRLIELRKKNGYSQDGLAERLNISRQAVSKWERAESLPDTENLIALSRLYNITLDEIVNGEKTGAAFGTAESHTYIITSPINRKKALNIVSFVFLGLGVIFVLIGAGFFLGFAVPETRDLRIARNESITPISAEVKRVERTSASVGGETMYKIVYEWPDGSGKSNAAYSRAEAEAMVGETVLIRVSGNRAVMIDYQRSALSIVGFVFIGVFGGLGVLFIGAFVLIFALNKRQKR